MSHLWLFVREAVMPELYSGTMPMCTPCLDGNCDDCPDFMWSDVYGDYACGCEEH